jgi:hypothetical protein
MDKSEEEETLPQMAVLCKRTEMRADRLDTDEIRGIEVAKDAKDRLIREQAIHGRRA